MRYNGTKLAEIADSLALSALVMTKGCTGIVSAAQDMLRPSARNALFADVRKIATGAITPEKAIDNCLALE